MSLALNLFSTSNDYTVASTRIQQKTVKVNLQVANAGIFLQLADDDQTGTNWSNDEVFYPPGAYSLLRKCSAARIRSAVAGSPAVVSYELLADKDT